MALYFLVVLVGKQFDEGVEEARLDDWGFVHGVYRDVPYARCGREDEG